MYRNFFFEGQLKISGNVMASNKLMILQKIDPSSFETAKKQRLATAKEHLSTASDSDTLTAMHLEITLADVFTAVNEYINTHPNMVERTNTTFQFKIKHPESSWFIDLKHDLGGAGAGEIAVPDVTLEMDEQHVETIFNGSLADVQKLFFSGQLKISGNVMASNKLVILQDMDKKLIAQARDQRVAAGQAPIQASISSHQQTTTKQQAKASEFLSKLQTCFQIHAEVPYVYQFHITEPQQSWKIDFANGTVQQGDDPNADVILTLTDQHFYALVSKQRDLRDLYQHGELMVEGAIRYIQHPAFLQILTDSFAATADRI